MFFLIGKGGQEGREGRIINNDAWWSCEISFDPELDEVFGGRGSPDVVLII
jgi:hypothetical protein